MKTNQRSKVSLSLLLAVIAMLVLAIQTGRASDRPVTALEADPFWTAFWANLWSGLIYSLIVGFLVSFIVSWMVGRKLLHYEQLMQDSRRRDEYRLQVATFKARLRGALNQEDAVLLHTVKEPGPKAAPEAFRIITESPVEIWQEFLKEE